MYIGPILFVLRISVESVGMYILYVLNMCVMYVLCVLYVLYVLYVLCVLCVLCALCVLYVLCVLYLYISMCTYICCGITLHTHSLLCVRSCPVAVQRAARMLTDAPSVLTITRRRTV